MDTLVGFRTQVGSLTHGTVALARAPGAQPHAELMGRLAVEQTVPHSSRRPLNDPPPRPFPRCPPSCTPQLGQYQALDASLTSARAGDSASLPAARRQLQATQVAVAHMEAFVTGVLGV